ncbi:hypothetical protein J6590_010222 [Homalodisca vitripennis]|nr:hypothetical protein J6590_010222 [Homalodisca vitripennis]
MSGKPRHDDVTRSSLSRSRLGPRSCDSYIQCRINRDTMTSRARHCHDLGRGLDLVTLIVSPFYSPMSDKPRHDDVTRSSLSRSRLGPRSCDSYIQCRINRDTMTSRARHCHDLGWGLDLVTRIVSPFYSCELRLSNSEWTCHVDNVVVTIVRFPAVPRFSSASTQRRLNDSTLRRDFSCL